MLDNARCKVLVKDGSDFKYPARETLGSETAGAITETGGVVRIGKRVLLLGLAIHMFFLAKLKASGAVLFLMGAVGMCIGWWGTGAQPCRATVPRYSRHMPASRNRLSRRRREPRDLFGDPLPAGAVLRLGTLQRRAVGATLSLSADGKNIIGLSGGKYVTVWDIETCKVRENRELPGSSWLAVLSPRGRFVATDGPDGVLCTSWT